jgi:hypothetical protein
MDWNSTISGCRIPTVSGIRLRNLKKVLLFTIGNKGIRREREREKNVISSK